MPYSDRFDLLVELPYQLSFRLLSLYLDIPTLCKASLCCKSWYRLVENDDLWRFLCKHYAFDEKYAHIGNEPQLELAVTPSQLNPVFDHSCFNLPRQQVCRFKRIFAYGFHANRNWRSGRYSVGPLLRGHVQQVTALGCSNRLVATGSEDGSLNVYDMVTAQLLYTLSNQSGQISQIIIFNANGNPRDDPDADPWILTASLDGYIRTFDATFGMLQAAMHVGKSITKMLLLEGVAVIATSTGAIEFWGLSSQSLIDRLNVHKDEIECLTNYGNKLIASGGWDKKMAVIKFEYVPPPPQGSRALQRPNTTQNNKHYAQMMFSNQLHDEAVTACCFANENRLISGSADGTVRFWEINSATCFSVGNGHQNAEYCVACCAATNMAASGASDSAVCIWSLDRGTFLRRLVGDHVGIVRCILMDAHKLISASDRKRVIVWDYASEEGKQLQVLHRQPLLVGHIWISPIRLVIASPEKPGAAVVLSFW